MTEGEVWRGFMTKTPPPASANTSGELEALDLSL